MAAPQQLPTEATDEGERIVVTPDRGTRLWAVGGAMIGLAVGVLLLVSGDGALMVLASIAATLGGVYLLLAQAQRLEFDADAARRRSWIRPTTVRWSEVTEARVTPRHERTPAAGSSRRLVELTLSTGAGGHPGRGLRRDQPLVLLHLEHQASEPELSTELHRSDVAQGEALLITLRDRGWLPEDVPVTVDADR
jgi:hypothetical protein